MAHNPCAGSDGSIEAQLLEPEVDLLPLITAKITAMTTALKDSRDGSIPNPTSTTVDDLDDEDEPDSRQVAGPVHSNSDELGSQQQSIALKSSVSPVLEHYDPSATNHAGTTGAHAAADEPTAQLGVKSGSESEPEAPLEPQDSMVEEASSEGHAAQAAADTEDMVMLSSGPASPSGRHHVTIQLPEESSSPAGVNASPGPGHRIISAFATAAFGQPPTQHEDVVAKAAPKPLKAVPHTQVQELLVAAVGLLTSLALPSSSKQHWENKIKTLVAPNSGICSMLQSEASFFLSVSPPGNTEGAQYVPGPNAELRRLYLVLLCNLCLHEQGARAVGASGSMDRMAALMRACLLPQLQKSPRKVAQLPATLLTPAASALANYLSWLKPQQQQKSEDVVPWLDAAGLMPIMCQALASGKTQDQSVHMLEEARAAAAALGYVASVTTPAEGAAAHGMSATLLMTAGKQLGARWRFLAPALASPGLLPAPDQVFAACQATVTALWRLAAHGHVDPAAVVGELLPGTGAVLMIKPAQSPVPDQLVSVQQVLLNCLLCCCSVSSDAAARVVRDSPCVQALLARYKDASACEQQAQGGKKAKKKWPHDTSDKLWSLLSHLEKVDKFSGEEMRAPRIKCLAMGTADGDDDRSSVSSASGQGQGPPAKPQPAKSPPASAPSVGQQAEPSTTAKDAGSGEPEVHSVSGSLISIDEDADDDYGEDFEIDND